MAKFHVNKDGDVGACSATVGPCPYGGEESHFTSEEAARSFYEAQHTSFSAIKKEPNETPAPNPQEPNWIYGTQASALAHYATAHNSGTTVLEQKNVGGNSVSLKMSSWPRANEAKKALEKKGYLVEFGENDMGQWIHASVAPRQEEILNFDDLSWNEESSIFMINESKLENNDLPKALYSARNGETIILDELKEIRGEGNQLLGWETKPKFLQTDWSVRIVRD